MKTRAQHKKNQTLTHKCESLYQAVKQRNLHLTENYLKAGAKPDFIYLRDNMGFTPFHAVIPGYEGSGSPEEKEEQIHIDLFDLLIKHSDHNTEIFSEDSYGMNPFEWAIADGKYQCTVWFLQLLEKPQFQNQSHQIINRQNQSPSCLPTEKCKRIGLQTPIQLAVKSESLDIVKELCKFAHKPNVGVCNANQNNAIHIAIQRKLPKILHCIARIAKSEDLKQKNSKNQTALEYATEMYQNSLKTPCLRSDILKSWQCKEIIQARINHALQSKWERIKNEKEPTHNTVMSLDWKCGEQKNPNTNALKPAKYGQSIHPIHDDCDKIGIDATEKYKRVSFDEAYTFQHSNPKWVTTFHGKLDTKQRYINRQKLSPFVTNFQKLFLKQRRQLNVTYNPLKPRSRSRSPSTSMSVTDSEEEKESECHNKKRRKNQRLSEPTFLYKNEWIKVEAINKELDIELTKEDRIKFYELSKGNITVCETEIREILDVTHPCKRHNIDEPVFGLFAKKNLPKKSIIIEYTGLVCTENEYLSSLGVNGYERFNGQWRTYELDTFKNSESRMLIDASYFGNESVFTNDVRCDIFGKWSTANVSFFEILICGWPHSFLRAFDNITAGDELLVDYGSKFWKQYCEDMRTSEGLTQHYLHRLEREKEAKQWSNVRRNKRKRDSNVNSNISNDVKEPRNKRRKLNAKSELCVINTEFTEILNGIKNRNDSELSAFVFEMEKKQKEMVRVCGEISNKYERGLQERDVKWREKVLEMNKTLGKRDQMNEILCRRIDEYDANTKKRDETVRKLNEQMPELLNAVETMAGTVRSKDKLIGKKNEEIKRLLQDNQTLNGKLEECVVKKKKYKDLCRELRKLNGNCVGNSVSNSDI